jgi:hypothetical protein
MIDVTALFTIELGRYLQKNFLEAAVSEGAFGGLMPISRSYSTFPKMVCVNLSEVVQ